MRRRTNQSDLCRRGITLFEVVLALAIFLGATAVIGQVLQNGSRAATQAHLKAEAALRAERKMNEVVSGALPLSTVQRSPFEDGTAWQWSLNIMETDLPNLLHVEVIVEHLDGQGRQNSAFQLERLMRDPIVYEEAALSSEEEI